MPRIAIVYLEAGGGHRATAQALAEAIRIQARDWELDLVNLEIELESLDLVRRLTGFHGYELYNWKLRHGWTFGAAHGNVILHFTIWALHRAQVRVWRKIWRTLQPDLVLSVSPHFNRAMCESFAAEYPGRPFVTLFTDFADCPPHFWIEDQDQHYICGTDRAMEQAIAAVGTGRTWRSSGTVIHPRFHEQIPVDRARGRRDLGLDPDLPTGLVLFGGYGSSRMLRIARQAAQYHVAKRPIQMIFLGGRNHKLAERLRNLSLPYRFHVQEFTDNVPSFMRLADFFIGKPGPGSITEALAMRLPVIVESNSFTLPQERYNVKWIRQQGVGLVIPSFQALPQALAEMLDPARRAAMLRRVDAFQNRAVFEVPEILEQILAGRGADDAAKPVEPLTIRSLTIPSQTASTKSRAG